MELFTQRRDVGGHAHQVGLARGLVGRHAYVVVEPAVRFDLDWQVLAGQELVFVHPRGGDLAVAFEPHHAESAFDSLAPSILASFEALGSGFSEIDRYQENLSALNEANRKAAEAAAEATKSQKDSWEDYFTEVEASFSAYRTAQDQTLTDQREWHANLNKIRAVAGDDYADLLTAQGREYASLHAAIANVRTMATSAGSGAASTVAGDGVGTRQGHRRGRQDRQRLGERHRRMLSPLIMHSYKENPS